MFYLGLVLAAAAVAVYFYKKYQAKADVVIATVEDDASKVEAAVKG